MAINKGPGNGQQIVSIMQGYNTNTNVTTDNHNSIILGSGNVIGDRVNALVVGNNLTVESNGIATTNLTVTETLNGRDISDILPTYKKYIALINQTSTNAPTVDELENTIGPIVWTRVGLGQYEGVLTGAFPNLDKSYLTISSVVIDTIATVSWSNANTIGINTYTLSAALVDGGLFYNALEIRIYE